VKQLVKGERALQPRLGGRKLLKIRETCTGKRRSKGKKRWIFRYITRKRVIGTPFSEKPKDNEVPAKFAGVP
jgi:hypothetical protein